ncbi:hypothetical protein PMAYCL1PPCAC_14589, partial [Pristionchus mayeri]
YLKNRCVYPWEKIKQLLGNGCTDLKEGDNLMEGIDSKDLIASGCFPTAFKMLQCDGSDYELTFVLNKSESHVLSEASAIGGLM